MSRKTQDFKIKLSLTVDIFTIHIFQVVLEQSTESKMYKTREKCESFNGYIRNGIINTQTTIFLTKNYTVESSELHLLSVVDLKCLAEQQTPSLPSVEFFLYFLKSSDRWF